MRVSLDHAHIFASDVELTLGFFQPMFGATGLVARMQALGHGFRNPVREEETFK